ncbi:MAG: hypothetical protein IJN76_02635 [Clostridia bacterium]|nr:hypothetical protein [Clostridia bacterium]
MSEFFSVLWDELGDLLSFFVTVALLQNVILTTGFGSSVMLHMVRKPKNIWLFSGILGVFSTLTVIIAYPLDKAFGTETENLWRPFMMVCITVMLYVAATLLTKKFTPNFYTRISRMLPMAAFNNLVTGIALICNAHVLESNLGGNIGLAIGSCLSFGLLTWLTAEGIERMDNPDMPEAFRGMPSTLEYVGLLGLALMGFFDKVNYLP